MTTLRAHPSRLLSLSSHAARATLCAALSTAVLAPLALSLPAQAATSTSKASAAAPTVQNGTVVEVREVEVKGKGSGVGVVAGAVVGGLLGNQIGKGTGNTVATVGGAVAGGFAGNEVEKHVKKHTVFKTTVKLQDGSTREFTLNQRHAVGAKVRIEGKKVSLAS